MLSRCHNPRIVTCKDGVRRSVPCGKCSACRSVSSYAWKQRLEVEMSQHKYTLFITLTYDENSLPYCIVNKDGSYSLSKYDVNCHLTDFLPPEVMSDLRLYYRCINGFYRVPVVNHYDIIDFTHKLKEKINDLRFFIQTEIGPTTLRPHAHGLLFFSSVSPEIACDLVCQSWSFCDWSIHREKLQLAYSASYVTSYVSSATVLPKIHTYKRFSMFSHKSTLPPIGSVAYSSRSLGSFQKEGALRTSLFKSSKLEFDEIPFTRYHENKYFPKLPYDSSLSSSVRTFLYKSYAFFKTAYNGYEASFSFSFDAYEAVFNHLFEISPTFHDSVLPLLTSESSVYRIYLASLNFCRSWDNFHPLYRDYCLDLHSYRSEMLKLKLQYKYEEEFCKKYSPCYLIYKDPVFVEDYSSCFGLVPNWVLLTLQGYGFRNFDDFSSQHFYYDLKHNPDVKQYLNTVDNILRESHKTKANNSYLASAGHPLYLNRGL